MSLPVILRRLAQAEFDAADWYEQRRAGRGAFTDAVRQVLGGIAAQPDAHPEVHGDVREALVPGYPYAVYYRPETGKSRSWLSFIRRGILLSGRGGPDEAASAEAAFGWNRPENGEPR
jgi:hypothetical protein